MRTLAVNAGSSSLKLRIVTDDQRIAERADLSSTDVADDAQLRSSLESLGDFDAVGHRVVHGGPMFHESVRIDAEVRRQLAALTALAPLHQPPALRLIDIVADFARDVPAVACFDTAFHSTLHRRASTYALPPEWRALGIHKYGFHGLAHSWTSRRAGELLHSKSTGTRIITCHLGAGASLAAVVDGKSVDTTMGFTPLDGLVMATRSGAIDPGALLWLQSSAGLGASDVKLGLENRSGILGLAGTADMAVVIDRAASGDADAELAVEVYIHRLVSSIASMAASAGGLDALVFSGGVGENAPVVRQMAVDQLGFLGVSIDHDRNGCAVADCDVSGDGVVRVFVVAAREDLEIDRCVRQVLRTDSP